MTSTNAPEPGPAPAFGKGDRVAWDHTYAPDHAPGSIVHAAAVVAKAPNAQIGTVQGVANDEGTHFDVLLDGEKESRTLTEDELVKVTDE